MGTLANKTLIVLLAIMLIIPVSVAGADEGPLTFSDISGTFWAKDEINSLVQLGIVSGFEDRTFRPQDPVTREQFAQLITLAFFLDLPTDDKQTFMDVSNTRWSYPAVEASKEFLTGYYPPNGRAFFDPTSSATREDVAVALVKTLGYEPDDLQNSDILRYYYDSDQISPNLRTYMALAVEKKLLTGYQDGRLRPAQAVTRAEAASLLYRVLKGAAGDSQTVLSLNVEAPETVSSPTFYIVGDVTKGADVYINNKQVEVVQGQFRLAVQLQEEGVYTYTISARMPGGKTQTVTKRVQFEKGGPELTVTGVPESTDQQQIKVSWTVKDANDYDPSVYINGERQSSYSSSASVRLEEGDNRIVIKAENKFGKSTEIVKHVYFQSGGPVLNVNHIPETTTKQTLSLSWTVSDKNDTDPKVYVNDEAQYYKNATITLEAGLNTIHFKAVNKLGKTTQLTRTVNFEPPAPKLTLNLLPETTNKATLGVSWTVSDDNDSQPTVYINGRQEHYNNANVTLEQGINTITVKAVNKFGKVTEVTKTVDFVSAGPQLQVQALPVVTSKKSVTVSWTVSDANDSWPTVYVNNQRAGFTTETVNLSLGENTIVVKAVNKLGQETEQSYVISFEPPAPTLMLGYAPATTESSKISLTWTVNDENDYAPKVYINDKLAGYNNELLSLKPGDNTFKIVAANIYGKTTELMYTVTYTPAP